MPGETIVIVEDNPLNLKLTRTMLDRSGYRIHTASNGQEALELIPRVRPDLVLMDLQLAGMDGLEVVRRLKADPSTRGAIVVALTAYAMKGDRERAEAAGCDGYITKPISLATFPGQIRTYLDAAASSTVRRPQNGQRSVLVVDDDPVQRKLVSIALEKAGFATVAANDGVDGLEKAGQILPDLIVSDILMPRLDGFRFCEAVRRNPRFASIPVVLTTSGTVQNVDEELAKKMGANSIVSSTVGLEEIAPAVTRALAGGAQVPREIGLDGLASICESFLAEGVQQSVLLVQSYATGLDLNAARQVVHRWAGTAGTLGFPVISQIAFEIECVLRKPEPHKAALEGLLRDLAALFDRALRIHRRAALPEWGHGLLQRRRIGLIGFAARDAERIIRVLQEAGATALAIDEADLDGTALSPDKIVTSEMVIVNAALKEVAASLKGSGAPVLLAGGDEVLREGTFDGGKNIHDLLVEPWTAEEIVIRCQRLLSAAGSVVAGGPVAPVDSKVPIQVLIVDDDPTIVAIVRSTFEGHGMECRTANHGGNVVQLAEERLPDVIVLDVNLPQMDGFQVLAALRANTITQNCGIVILTARQQETDIMKSFGLGVDDYVVKPFSPMELVARVRRLARRQKSR